jgi:hypothetical protein
MRRGANSVSEVRSAGLSFAHRMKNLSATKRKWEGEREKGMIHVALEQRQRKENEEKCVGLFVGVLFLRTKKRKKKKRANQHDLKICI